MTMSLKQKKNNFKPKGKIEPQHVYYAHRLPKIHWYACGADGRSVGGRRSVYGHVITKFSGMGRLP